VRNFFSKRAVGQKMFGTYDLDISGSSTSHNSIGLHGLLQGQPLAYPKEILRKACAKENFFFLRDDFLYLQTTILQFTTEIFVPIIPADVFRHICNFLPATIALCYLLFSYIFPR
jgi:hypothetical protein